MQKLCHVCAKTLRPFFSQCISISPSYSAFAENIRNFREKLFQSKSMYRTVYIPEKFHNNISFLMQCETKQLFLVVHISICSVQFRMMSNGFHPTIFIRNFILWSDYLMYILETWDILLHKLVYRTKLMLFENKLKFSVLIRNESFFLLEN